MSQRETDPKRVPRLSSADEVDIPWAAIEPLIAGRSVVDLQRLYLPNIAAASRFLLSYGFDTQLREDREWIAVIQDKALAYIEGRILPWQGMTEVPEPYRSMTVEELLVAASSPETQPWPNWPCVMLKVLHCAAHTLFNQDHDAHRVALETVRKRYLPYLLEQQGSQWIGDDGCKIPLVEFRIKEEKSFERIMTKLLHKPGNLASEVYDHLGVRLVTYDIFSAVLLIQFLRSRGIIMLANQLPERSRNSLAELDEIHRLYGVGPPGFIVEKAGQEPTELASRDNPFTDRSFRMFKFVERLILRMPSGRRQIFPYEIQVLDANSLEASHHGDATHDAYEERQMRHVRRRLFGLNPLAGQDEQDDSFSDDD
ncbi:TIGR04552 family protein [Pokkaliibacter sp. CJK22405]|uniref:TIGR04552 family protein n=1 Tax=Pokkaliibacter sp. CJK22405 TaxID=3384615 RepID=UPI00398471E0